MKRYHSLLLLSIVVALIVKRPMTSLAQTAIPNDPGQVTALVWNFDGTRLAAAYNSGHTEILDSGGQQLALYKVAPQVSFISWNPTSNNEVVYGTASAQIAVLDVDTSKQRVFVQVGRPKGGYDVSWSPDGTKIASYDIDGIGAMDRTHIKIWDASTGDNLAVFDGLSEGSGIIQWKPGDSHTLAGISSSGGLAIWNTDTNERFLSVREDRLYAGLAWSPDGSQIALSTYDAVEDTSEVQIRNATTGRKLTGHNFIGYITSISWNPNRNIAVNPREYIAIWDPATDRVVSTISVYIAGSLSWSINGLLAYAVSGYLDIVKP